MQVLEAIITLAMSDIPCTCNDRITTVSLQHFTYDGTFYLIGMILTLSHMRCHIKAMKIRCKLAEISKDRK